APTFALRNSVVYSCIKILCETLSTLSVRLIDKTTKKESLDHPVVQLFNEPNEDQTFTEFLEMFLVNYFVWGNAYAEKEIQRGRISAIYPMAAARTVVLRDQDRVLYEYVPVNGRPSVTLAGENVMHFRMFGADDLTGTSPIWAAERAIQLALTMEEMSIASFADGVKPDFVITLPPERVLERINQ